MTQTPVYRQNPTVPARPLGDDVAIITPRTAQVHRLNALGAAIWRRCEGSGVAMDELVAWTVARYEVDEETARADVERFVHDALDKGILVQADPAAS